MFTQIARRQKERSTRNYKSKEQNAMMMVMIMIMLMVILLMNDINLVKDKTVDDDDNNGQ